jgi:hypothetical protein
VIGLSERAGEVLTVPHGLGLRLKGTDGAEEISKIGAEMAANVAYVLASKGIRPEMSHGVRCRLTMFTKQVSRPMNQSRSPIAAAESQQVGQLEKYLLTGPIRNFCALQAQIEDGVEGPAFLLDPARSVIEGTSRVISGCGISQIVSQTCLFHDGENGTNPRSAA